MIKTKTSIPQKIKLWAKRNFVCRFRDHLYRDTKGNRLYFCHRCGHIDGRVKIVGKPVDY